MEAGLRNGRINKDQVREIVTGHGVRAAPAGEPARPARGYPDRIRPARWELLDDGVLSRYMATSGGRHVYSQGTSFGLAPGRARDGDAGAENDGFARVAARKLPRASRTHRTAYRGDPAAGGPAGKLHQATGGGYVRDNRKSVGRGRR